jgi:hypothetical protein
MAKTYRWKNLFVTSQTEGKIADMPIYTGCRIQIKVPINYLEKEKLTVFFESEYEGCLINVEKDGTTKQPTVEEAFVPDTSPLSGARASAGWAPIGTPAPMENVSARGLLHSATETMEKFLYPHRFLD